MLKKLFLFLSVFLILSAPVQSAFGQSDGGDLDLALEWLESQLQDDGGFSNGFAPESDVGTTADAVLAFVDAGWDPQEVVSQSGISPLDFLREYANSTQDAGPGVAAKVAYALNAAGFDPRTYGQRDLIGLILDGYDPASGLFGLGPFDSALSILALIASGTDVPAGAIDGLLATRLDDGSFAFSYDPSLVTGDSNTTAIVLQALVAAGSEGEIGATVEYFRSTQNEDGGWTYQKPSEFGEETDSNSTALVIQALRVAGEDLNEWGEPLTVLASLQEPSGAFGYSASFGGDNILATLQAIPTLAGADYISPVPSVRGPSNSDENVIIVVLVLLIVVLGAVTVINRNDVAGGSE